MLTRHTIKCRVARRGTQGGLDIDIARTGRGEAAIRALPRFDIDAGPAAIVECAGDGIRVRMAGPDVDIKSALDMPQCPPEQHVLEILGVGHERHEDIVRRLAVAG